MDRIIHISLGGPTLQIEVGGKLVPFEMHPHCGPHPCHKTTGELLKRIPPGFWEAIDLWVKSGERLNGGRCIVPDVCRDCEGRGDVIKHLGGRHYEMVGQCAKCKGRGWLDKELD